MSVILRNREFWRQDRGFLFPFNRILEKESGMKYR
jgi:hypothetical protein